MSLPVDYFRRSGLKPGCEVHRYAISERPSGYLVWCQDCVFEMSGLTASEARNLLSGKLFNGRDRSAVAGQPQPADAPPVGNGSPDSAGPEAGAPASDGAPMTTRESD